MPQGGVEGYKIKADEIDNEYKVPQAVEAYQRHKQQGAVLMTLYGTPMTVALNQRLEEDKIADDLARLRDLGRGGRHALSLPVPDRRDLLVAGRRLRPVRQGQARRQPERQEDRLHLLRQSGRARAAADHRGIAEEGGVRAAHLRRAAAGRRGRCAGARHNPALSAGFRHRASLRPGAGGGDQGVQGETAIRCRRWSGWCGPPPRPTSWRGGGFGAAEGYHAMQFAGAGDDYPVRQRDQGDVQEGRQRADQADGREHRLLQPRSVAGGDPCRGDPQRAEGERRQAADRRRHQEGPRADPRLHASAAWSRR